MNILIFWKAKDKISNVSRLFNCAVLGFMSMLLCPAFDLDLAIYIALPLVFYVIFVTTIQFDKLLEALLVIHVVTFNYVII